MPFRSCSGVAVAYRPHRPWPHREAGRGLAAGANRRPRDRTRERRRLLHSVSGLDVPRRLDERRILWAAGDIVEHRPALSRWHPDHAEAFAAFVKEK
jgi:hypothetical protein